MKKHKVNISDRHPIPNTLIKPEQVQEIDYEICWCIEKLENILSKNITDKERKQCEMSLRILRNPETAFIKKRQVMRQQFGDYRKVIAGKKKNLKNNVSKINVQFKDVDIPVKSVFIRTKSIALNETSKKSIVCSNSTSEAIALEVNDGQHQKNMSGIRLSDNSFRFNF